MDPDTEIITASTQDKLCAAAYVVLPMALWLRVGMLDEVVPFRQC